MASLEIAEAMSDYGPRVLAVAVPWLFVRWGRSRARPILWVERSEKDISITTSDVTPIENLSLRLLARDERLFDAPVLVADETFTEAKLSRPSSAECRVTTTRFSRRDRIAIVGQCAVDVEVLCSNAVPVAGRSTWLARGVDYIVGLLMVATLLMLVAGPLRDFLVPDMQHRQQSQDGSNIAFEDLVVSTAIALLLIALYIGTAMLMVPARRALFFGRKTLSVPVR